MAIDKIGPVPPAVAAGAPSGEIPSVLEWFTKVLARLQRNASTTERGSVLQTTAVTDLNQTIANPPTQAEVQAITDKIDELLAAQRTAGQVST